MVVEALGVHGLGYLAYDPPVRHGLGVGHVQDLAEGWTRRSRFVKVPSFSAKVDDGSTTLAAWAISERNVSCTTRNSSFRAASRASPSSPLVKLGLSPQ